MVYFFNSALIIKNNYFKCDRKIVVISNEVKKTK